MDYHDVAQLITPEAEKAGVHSLELKRGTVKAINNDGTLSVVIDGSSADNLTTIGCACSPSNGDRVIILASGTQWTAVATVGGDNGSGGDKGLMVRKVSINLTGYGMTMTLIREGNLVTLQNTSTNNAAIANGTIVTNVPLGYRPKAPVSIAVSRTLNSGYYDTSFTVLTDGGLMLQHAGLTASVSPYFSGVWLTEDPFPDGGQIAAERIPASRVSTVDYIIEQSVNVNPDNGWVWRKWASGIAECWMNLNISVALGSVLSNTLAYSGQFALPQYPFAFIETPNWAIDITHGSYGTWAMVRGVSATSPGTCQIQAGSSSTIAATGYTIAIQAKGRWAEFPVQSSLYNMPSPQQDSGTPFNCSVTEQVMPYTWDGKTVYGRMFQGTVTAASYAYIELNLISGGVDSILKSSGYFMRASTTKAMIGGVVLSGTTVYQASCINVVNGNLSFGSSCSDVRTNQPYEIWAEYTKL